MSKATPDYLDRQLQNARKIVGRIMIEGELVLETPTRFGNGDGNGLVDMTVSRDPLDGRPLLPGASIAGALRSYLRTREIGFRQLKHVRALGEELLFGYEKHNTDTDGTNDGTTKDKGSSQSYLIAYDSLAAELITELRDGVAIDPKTRTAIENKKYDWEVLAAGTTFPLRLELLVVDGEKGVTLKSALAMALQGFEQGEIPMGARRRRGFGKCRVANWRVRHYDFTKPSELIAWLQEDQSEGIPNRQSGEHIAGLLGAQDAERDQRTIFSLEALFGLAGSLLIRAGSEEPGAPDMVHLRSKRNGTDVPILSGTSLAGALRARALRIAKAVGHAETAKFYINDLFGPQIEGSKDKPVASRLWVEESVIKHPHELVVSRVKIDRFTGGSFPTALFTQQPVFGTDETALEVRVQVHNPTDADKGLLLLLLKDLWTEDLPLGGEASVGRGRLRGKCAKLTSKQPPPAEKDEAARATTWEISQGADRLVIQGDRNAMQVCVDAFCQRVQEVRK